MTTGSTPETKAERTRRNILESAVTIFGRSGLRASSIAEICRDAGVSGSLAYAYFEDKDDLFRAALDHDAASVIHDNVARLVEQGSIAALWQPTTFDRLVDTIEQHPLTSRVLAGLEPAVTSKMIELPALDDLRAALTELLIDGQNQGTVRTDIDPITTASAGVQLWIITAMANIQFGRSDADQRQAICDFFRAAIANPDATIAT